MKANECCPDIPQCGDFPIECGQPTRGYTLKIISPSISQQLMAASRYLRSQGWDFMLNSSFQAGLWSCLGLHKTWVCCGLHYELPCAAVLYSGDTVFLSLTTPVSYTFSTSSPTEPCKGELCYVCSVKDRVFCTL